MSEWESLQGDSGAIVLSGRVIKSGRGAGQALVSREPIGFLGGVDPDTGLVLEPGHPLQGRSVAGKVLVFPTGKGSTVGSYTILRLARSGHGPVAMVNAQSEAIVAVGAIIADIPMVDQVNIDLIEDGDWVIVEDGVVTVMRARQTGSQEGDFIARLQVEPSG
jgi:predicted aconitase with swiveling domain